MTIYMEIKAKLYSNNNNNNNKISIKLMQMIFQIASTQSRNTAYNYNSAGIKINASLGMRWQYFV